MTPSFSLGTTTTALNRLEFPNHLYLTEKVFRDSHEYFSVEFSYANAVLAVAGDQDTPIYLHLDMPEGGLAHYGLEIADLILQAQEYGTKVVAVIEEGSFCYSACTFIFMAAHK